MIPKQQPIRSKHIRAAAKGEQCCMQIMGVCNGDPFTTVCAHLPSETHGMARKSDDFPNVVFACGSCHDAIDRRTHSAELEAHREWYLRRGMERTLRRLYEKGVIQVRGAA